MAFITLRYRKAKKRQANIVGSNPTSPHGSPKKSASFVTSKQTLNTSQDGKQSIKLTMKVAPSKLREVMRANEVDSLKDTLGGGQVLDGPRSRRSATTTTRESTGRTSRPKYVEPRESDLDDDIDDEEDDLDEEEDEIEPDVTMNDFDEVGAEAEGGTDDEDDADMEDDSPAPTPRIHQMPPKAPKITIKTPAKSKSGRPEVIITPANVGPLQSVEDEEMEDGDDDDDDDEDLDDDSELPDDEDETNLNDEDPEGDTELMQLGPEDIELEDLDDEGLSDSDDEEPGSGTATPDPSKLTSRQRGKVLEPLMSLDMAPQQRKFFTEAEKAMKKDEHARKRKELTKRKTQEEKTAALNRLVCFMRIPCTLLTMTAQTASQQKQRCSTQSRNSCSSNASCCRGGFR